MRKILLILVVLSFTLLGFAQTKVAPLNFKQRTLKNGLNVVSLQDNSSPTVSVQVWYDVGSKDDPAGKSGFAHLFEHLMFKSTKNLKSEMFDRLTEDVGGYNNASTWDDLTNYYEVVPSNYLETLLWAESDRMTNLNVNEENFKSERDVVKEEFRQRVLANPYGMLFGQYIDKLSYAKHPYMRPGIGNIDELNASSLEDAQLFYKAYYRPDNANLIVAGNFDQKQLDSWVDKYFGRLQKPSTGISEVAVVEPARSKEIVYNETAPNVPLPAVAITYLAPISTSADVSALKIAEAILSDGESSRLYQSLIRDQQVASSASFNADIRKDKGLLTFLAIASAEHDLPEIEKAILAQLKMIQDAPPSDKELEKAKNLLISRTLEERETNAGKANQIGRAVIFDGSPNAVNTDISNLQKVTAKDVQMVMKKYFADNNRVVINYRNKADAAEIKGAQNDGK